MPPGVQHRGLPVPQVCSKHSCKSSTSAFGPVFGACNRVLIHGLDRALSPHELAYQEALVQEREHEIREIETGIHELNEITRDLATIIIEQGTMIGASYCLNPFSLETSPVSCRRPVRPHELSLSSDIDRPARRQHRIEYLLRRSKRPGSRPRGHHCGRLPTQSGQSGNVLDDHRRHCHNNRSNRCTYAPLCPSIPPGVLELHARTKGRCLFPPDFWTTVG